jgi:asparagine synthase (glutamine-hydrolysing)
MCGIAGFTFSSASTLPARGAEGDALRRMVAALHHRGPDALNGLLVDNVALGHTRLAIVDLAGGIQPMRDESTGVTVIFNGEIFNHVELRERLRARYAFRTRSDTEVILAAFLDRGIDCVEDFNGQFAFALYDPRDGSLYLARDRYGKRPIFYAYYDGGVCFASEAKALFASGKVAAELDPISLWETLHLWAPTDERSMFAGVHAVPPATVAHLPRDGRTLEMRRYWQLDLADERVEHGLTEARALDELAALLDDAIRLRLRADVPVAAYLSGGLDSSLLCALAQQQLGGTLQTFSVGFAQQRYDERAFQAEVAAALGTEHHSVLMEDADIGTLLPQVVEHAEAVLLRSAPAPLHKLSGLVRGHNTKVVLTGEGADEVFGGYDLFKEAKVRQFWARRPSSSARPALLGRLYPYLALSRQGSQLIREFYGVGLDEPGALDFSHRIRWSNSGRVTRFLSTAVLDDVRGHDPAAALFASIPDDVGSWRPLARAQYLEVRTLLSQYLLSSQGDRMLMAHSVEGRFPFLDHRLADFSARLPDWMKLRGLTEKYLLKKFAVNRVPSIVVDRPKYPYRAPIAEALTGPSAPEWSRQLLGRDAVDDVGAFDGAKVEKLVAKLTRGNAQPSEADNMALVAVATTQLLAERFLGDRTLSDAHLDAVALQAA